MGKATELLFKRADEPGASEHTIQSAYFAAVRTIEDPRVQFIHAIPNGGHREQIIASQLKAEGVKAGIFDVCLPFWSGTHPFAYLEFKKPERRGAANGGMSDKQVEFSNFLTTQNAFWRVVYTWEEGFAATLEYLGAK